MKYALGFFCFHIYMNMPGCIVLTKFGMWLLSWAGYYAFYDHDNPEIYK